MQLRTICLCRLILMLMSKKNPEEPHKEQMLMWGSFFGNMKENLDMALHFHTGYLIIEQRSGAGI